jgi:hypothetical protein
MKSYSLISSMIAALFLLSCSSSKKVATEPEPIVKRNYIKDLIIDGRPDDWQNLSFLSNPAGTLEYAIAQNEQNLFIMMRVANHAEQIKLLNSGMEIWIDPTGKKAKTTEVIYPVKGELSEDVLRPQSGSIDQKMNIAQMHLKVAAELISLSRIGFKPEFSGVQSIFQNTGFKAAINWDENNTLIYELKIPLNAFKDPLPKQKMEIGFSISGLERQKTSSPESGNTTWQQRGNGMRGESHGGRGGGGYGSYGKRQASGEGTVHRSTDSTNDWKKATENESFWIQYTS